MSTPHCVILGGGHAGAQLAASLRQQGWQGEITLVGEEPVPPYQRPPLSKGYLLGETTLDKLQIKSPQAYEKLGIALKLGVRADRIDRQDKQVHLNNGEVLRYTALALTLGAQVRQLTVPGADLDGVFHLRTLADIDRIRAFIERPGKQRAVIVGGGYIGLETAAVLRKLGLAVTVLEALPRLLQRVATADIAGFYQRVHTEEGVEILCNRTVQSLEGDGEEVAAVVCASGETLPADVVIVGIGVIPNTALAAAAGLHVGNGIVVNECAQTSDPDIVSAGDCAEFFSVPHGRRMRLESVPHAMAQATIAASTLCGQSVAYQAQPWFWSDQYDLKLQMLGLSQGHDQAVLRGEHRSGRSFSVFYLTAGKLMAVDCINQPKVFMVSKKLIASGLSFKPEQLADTSLDLSSLLHQESPQP